MFARSLIVLLALASIAAANDENRRREREAEAILLVELELQKRKAPLVISYTDAVKEALKSDRAIVAYPANREAAKCPPGAICAKGAAADEVWIVVPKDGSMVIAETLPGNATDEQILKAFRKAVPKPEAKESSDPFFIDLMLAETIGQVCPGGKCVSPATTQPVAPVANVVIPRQMPGHGPVWSERPRPIRDLLAHRPHLFARVFGRCR